MSDTHSYAAFSFQNRRVLVLGDVILDRFVYGRASRISPEAPIPVLLIDRELAMPGGAANVARNVASLGGKAVLIGVVGADAAGRELKAMIDDETGVTTDFLILPGATTTQKVRYIAGQQQLLRADIEQPADVAPAPLTKIFARHLQDAEAVILSDYAKGVLTPALLAQVIAAARKAGVPVIADPKSNDFSRYDGATLITPNRGEATVATGISGEDDVQTAAAANAILKSVPNTEAVLVTRGPHGMTLAKRGQDMTHYPAMAHEVFDVSGAGDTVIATLALALAGGHKFSDAAIWANAAASIVVGKHNTATVTHDELRKVLAPMHPISDFKVMGYEDAVATAERWRATGQTVGFTNGCFDLIHPGHISLLTQARAECDRLIVGLNTDASVKRLKGSSRPFQDEISRAIVLGSLSAVDMVVLFDQDTPLELIRALHPAVLIKGQDYTVDKVVGAEDVMREGGRVFLADITKGQSTTNTIARINKSPD